MKFRILNQGIGAAETPLPEDVAGALRIEIEGADGEVVKLVGEEHVVYGKVEQGAATFDRAGLVGRIGLSLVRASGTVPLGGFICVPTAEGVRLYQDAADMLERLARVERDISDSLVVHDKLGEKYKALEDKLSRLFDGYNF